MHKILFANGTRAENVYPGAQNMRALKPKDRGDLLRLLPGLQEQPAEECYGGTAYRFATWQEVKASRLPQTGSRLTETFLYPAVAA